MNITMPVNGGFMTAANNPIGWFELYVADMERARRFYEAVFQCKLAELPPVGTDLRMCMFPWHEGVKGISGALVQTALKAPGDGGTLVYFTCEDCAVEAARAKNHGGVVIRPRMSIGEYGFIAIVRDSEGNTIGLHSNQ